MVDHACGHISLYLGGNFGGTEVVEDGVQQQKSSKQQPLAAAASCSKTALGAIIGGPGRAPTQYHTHGVCTRALACI